MILNVCCRGGCEGRGSGEEKEKGHFIHNKIETAIFVCAFKKNSVNLICNYTKFLSEHTGLPLLLRKDS